MPIKPANLCLYPADWKAISRESKERARWRCQWPGCTAHQYDIGMWILQPIGRANWHCMAKADSFKAARQEAAEASFGVHGDGPGAPKIIVIVLTVAHLNHDPADVRPENLRAWCQRHHLAYDAKHHQANAQATRRARAGTLELF